MAIQMGSSGRSAVSDINMTPMIDVLLVLLVIFMIAQPLLQRSIDVQVPVEHRDAATPPSAPIVLEITRAGYSLNSQRIPKEGLADRLAHVYAGRRDRVLFVKAEDDVIYQDYIATMDAARGAGVKVIGAVLPRR